MTGVSDTTIKQQSCFQKNISPSQGRSLEILRGKGVSKVTFFKGNFEARWGGGFKPKNLPWRGVWIFSGTTHSQENLRVDLQWSHSVRVIIIMMVTTQNSCSTFSSSNWRRQLAGIARSQYWSSVTRFWCSHLSRELICSFTRLPRRSIQSEAGDSKLQRHVKARRSAVHWSS